MLFVVFFFITLKTGKIFEEKGHSEDRKKKKKNFCFDDILKHLKEYFDDKTMIVLSKQQRLTKQNF